MHSATVASEASAGTNGGWGDCDDLATWRRRDYVDASAHHAGTRTRKEGTGDLSSSNPDAALKLKKRREIQAHYCQNMSAVKHDRERQRLDSIQMNETPEEREVQVRSTNHTKRGQKIASICVATCLKREQR